MRVLWLTAVNDQIWRDYAEHTVKTWYYTPTIEWEHSQGEWHEWRERNRDQHPETEGDFRHTWLRFSHKVQAQCQHLERELGGRDYDYLVWLDADVTQKAPLAETELGALLPQRGDVCSYLSRGDDYHPETGWICYDLNDPRLAEFTDTLKDTYLSDRIFTLREWHDAWVWDWVCRQLALARTNLCDSPPKRGEAFARSRLAPYFEHHKGRRKHKFSK